VHPIPVHAFNPGPITGAGNWTWLISGRLPTLVDAGTGDPRHLDAITTALNGTALAQVIVTHSHSDHASGAPAIAERWPAVRFFKMPWAERDAKWPVPWLPIDDGAAIEVGDTTVVAIHTPGHAPDHLCFWHAESRTVIAALHDLDLVKSMFPEALLLAREPVAWGATKDVLTAENLLKARRMCEAFDEHAHECAA